jgi:hypothetical protein
VTFVETPIQTTRIILTMAILQLTRVIPHSHQLPPLPLHPPAMLTLPHPLRITLPHKAD